MTIQELTPPQKRSFRIELDLRELVDLRDMLAHYSVCHATVKHLKFPAAALVKTLIDVEKGGLK